MLFCRSGLRRRRRDSQGVFGVFLSDDLLGLPEYFGRRSLRITEEVRRPQTVQFPALRFMNQRAEEVPFHRIVGLRITCAVAENSQGDIIGSLRMVQCEIDAEAFVAPVDVGGGFVSLTEMGGGR